MNAAVTLALAALLLGASGRAAAATVEGTVVDAATRQPIAQASVVVGSRTVLSDAAGRFTVATGDDGGDAAAIAARAHGYGRATAALPAAAPLVLRLTAVRPKALYLSAYGIGNKALRTAALALIATTELNALVVDVKGDRGIVPFRSQALARAGVAQTVVTVDDMAALLQTLHRQGIYLIARVVVFKDAALVQRQPQWAVRDGQGVVWTDREGQHWIDPLQPAAWQLSLDIAEEAARLGFDEIQFDYLRFPDATGLVFSQPNTEPRRVAAIGAFLDAARQRLAPHNVFVAADIFGYVAWNSNDTQIGQQLEALAQRVDYLCPMLYPSGFSFGIPGHRDPVREPAAIVAESLQRMARRTGLPGVRVRPWLQAFRDYAFDHRVFDGDEIRAQIDAAERSGSDGWMLWNARNQYDPEGLVADPADGAASAAARH